MLSIKQLLSERQNVVLPSSVFVAAVILISSSLGPILLYVTGLVASAILGIILYFTLRIKFSSRHKSLPKYPGEHLILGRDFLTEPRDEYLAIY